MTPSLNFEGAVREALSNMRLSCAAMSRNLGALPTDVRRCPGYLYTRAIDALPTTAERASARAARERDLETSRRAHVAAALQLESEGRSHLYIR